MSTSEPNWKEAQEHLDFLITEYRIIGWAGSFGLMTLLPLKERLDSGERTRELYEEIMACE